MPATLTIPGNVCLPGDVIQLRSGPKAGMKVRVTSADLMTVEFDEADLALNRKARRSRRKSLGSPKFRL